MAIQFSHQFHRHWLAAPTITRRKIKADLEAIVELLKPETALANWQKQHGIYHTDTSKAEQVGLFDTPEELASTEKSAKTSPKTTAKKTTQQSDIDIQLGQSLFLKSVTAGLAAETTPAEPPQTEIHPKALATHVANSKATDQSQSDFLQSIEAKIDDYLAFSMKNIKADVMAWVEEELAAQGIQPSE